MITVYDTGVVRPEDYGYAWRGVGLPHAIERADDAAALVAAGYATYDDPRNALAVAKADHAVDSFNSVTEDTPATDAPHEEVALPTVEESAATLDALKAEESAPAATEEVVTTTEETTAS